MPGRLKNIFRGKPPEPFTKVKPHGKLFSLTPNGICPCNPDASNGFSDYHAGVEGRSWHSRFGNKGTSIPRPFFLFHANDEIQPWGFTRQVEPRSQAHQSFFATECLLTDHSENVSCPNGRNGRSGRLGMGLRVSENRTDICDDWQALGVACGDMFNHHCHRRNLCRPVMSTLR